MLPMMLPMMLPPMPEPHRCLFDSDAEYEKAMKRYRAEKRTRNEMMKDQEAAMILASIIIIGSVIGMFALILHMLGGIKGILYGLSVIGLLWVAYVQIRRRL